jgi:hypothetical protein
MAKCWIRNSSFKNCGLEREPMPANDRDFAQTLDEKSFKNTEADLSVGFASYPSRDGREDITGIISAARASSTLPSPSLNDASRGTERGSRISSLGPGDGMFHF